MIVTRKIAKKFENKTLNRMSNMRFVNRLSFVLVVQDKYWPLELHSLSLVLCSALKTRFYTQLYRSIMTRDLNLAGYVQTL